MQNSSTAKLGNNINQKIDTNLYGTEFIKYFYTNWSTNLQELLNKKIINEHTKIKFKKVKYQKEDLIKFLTQINNEGVVFNIIDYEISDSGSRKIDILVNGEITVNNNTNEFTQTLLIANNKYWFLQNSLFIIK